MRWNKNRGVLFTMAVGTNQFTLPCFLYGFDGTHFLLWVDVVEVQRSDVADISTAHTRGIPSENVEQHQFFPASVFALLGTLAEVLRGDLKGCKWWDVVQVSSTGNIRTIISLITLPEQFYHFRCGFSATLKSESAAKCRHAVRLTALRLDRLRRPVGDDGREMARETEQDAMKGRMAIDVGVSSNLTACQFSGSG